MVGVPTNFQAISNVLPTYNYVDIVSGTGYINFYGGKTIDKNLLSNFTYYSDSVLSGASVPAGVDAGGTLRLDEDLDVLLNRPMTLRGLSIVNLPVSVYCAGSNTIGVYAIVFVRKWDGVTETDIATNQSRTYSASFGGAGTGYSMLSIDLDIPLTTFKIGEYLRFTVRLYSTNSSGALGGTVYYAHDPKSRTTGWDTSGAVPSQLSIQIPTRLNL